MEAGLFKLILFAVLAVVGYFANRAKEKAGKATEKARPVDSFPGTAGPSAPPAGTRSGDTAETEKMRKFFEALGLPKTDIPPAPVAPRNAPPPIPPKPAPSVQKAQPKQQKTRLDAPPPPLPGQSRPTVPSPPPRRTKGLDSWDDNGRPVRSPCEALGADLDPALREVDPRFDREAVAGAVRGVSKQARAEFTAATSNLNRAGDVTPAGRGAVATGRGMGMAAESSADLARQLVAHPDALKRAMILQEILGLPLALRDPAAPRG